MLAVLTAAGLLLLGAAACGHEGPASATSPLPHLTPGQRTPATGTQQLQAGIGRNRDVYFRSRTDRQAVTIQILRGVWREELVATDATSHARVLAVALRVTNTGHAAWSSNLRTNGELDPSDGVVRRSGRFSVAGQLGAMTLKPGEVRDGWLAFENVDWAPLRGTRTPPVARFRLDVFMGSGLGRGEWLVDAGFAEEGEVRRVHLPVLGASVAYLIN